MQPGFVLAETLFPLVNPIHLTLATAVIAFSGITSARVQLSLYALDLGAGGWAMRNGMANAEAKR